MDKKLNNYGTLEAYQAQQKEQEEATKKRIEELKAVANRLFSTEDGKVLARAMIRGCRMLETDNRTLSDDELRTLKAYQDFVNTFITKLVDRKVFMGILEEI